MGENGFLGRKLRGIVQGLCVVLAVSILAYALPKVGTTTWTSGQVPTPTEFNTALNLGPNWINTNYLGGGTTPTIPGGDSLDVQGTLKADTSRFTGIIDLACNIIPRADTTQILGNPTYRFRAIDTDTARVLFFVATQAGATQALGTVTVANSFTVNSGSALNLNSLADSTDIKDASVSGADLAAALSGRKTFHGGLTLNDSLIVASGAVRLGTANLWVHPTTGQVIIGALTSSSAKFGIENTSALSSNPLVYIHDNASSGTHDQAVLSITQDYASASGPLIQTVLDGTNTSVLRVKSAVSSGTAANANLWSGGMSGIADDGTATILSGTETRPMALMLNVTTGQASSSALINVRMTATPACGVASQSGDYTIAATTSDVTGTTGVDGQVTVSARASGVLEIENRSGLSLSVYWWAVTN